MIKDTPKELVFKRFFQYLLLGVPIRIETGEERLIVRYTRAGCPVGIKREGGDILTATKHCLFLEKNERVTEANFSFGKLVGKVISSLPRVYYVNVYRAIDDRLLDATTPTKVVDVLCAIMAKKWVKINNVRYRWFDKHSIIGIDYLHSKFIKADTYGLYRRTGEEWLVTFYDLIDFIEQEQITIES